MSDEHTLSDSAVRNIGRLRDAYRVHGSAKKDKKDDRKRREKEFRELLELGAKEPDEFPAEKPFEERVQMGTKTMLNHLSAGAAPIIIESPEPKKNGNEENG